MLKPIICVKNKVRTAGKTERHLWPRTVLKMAGGETSSYCTWYELTRCMPPIIVPGIGSGWKMKVTGKKNTKSILVVVLGIDE